MYQVRWDRLLALVAILSFPLLYSWLKRNIRIVRFSDSPLFEFAHGNPELRQLLLLGVLLVGLVLLLKALRN